MIRLAMLALLLLPACESAHLQAARGEDTPDAYRRFLSRHRQGRAADSARGRLEELVYREARRLDRPLGYHRLIGEFPEGRFVALCRTRLAELALLRARSAADLELVLERHPGSPAAAQAAARLPGLLARQALAAASPEPAQRFLDRYPSSPEAPRVRAHLAAQRYRQLPAEPLALESFAETFAGTEQAGTALERLETLLAEEVQASGEEERLRQFRARFPGSPRLAELDRTVEKLRLQRALAWLDLAALEQIAPGGGPQQAAARQVLAWCRPRRSRCQALSLLARQAAPWRSQQSLESLRAQVFDADLPTAWAATMALARFEESTAAALLVELLGVERISTVWVAERALASWLERRGARGRAFGELELRRPLHQANEEERQRRGGLLLLLGQQARGEQLLGPLLEHPGRQLASSYLLLRQARRQGRGTSSNLLERFLAGAGARLTRLRDAFPARVGPDSLPAAQLVEQELFALERALSSVLIEGGSNLELLELQRAAARQLLRWQGELSQASPGFRPAREPAAEPAEAAHQQGRLAALARLALDRSPVARSVLEASCQTDTLAAASATCRGHKPSSR